MKHTWSCKPFKLCTISNLFEHEMQLSSPELKSQSINYGECPANFKQKFTIISTNTALVLHLPLV